MDAGEDEIFMKMALRLAKRGEGWVSPNPLVGAVIVKDGRVIAQGYHRRYGGDHAEVDAIKRAREPLEGATLYVNLEPCCHWGKTPPCTDRILEAGIKRVVISNLDPNPLVSGKGKELLEGHGVSVHVGVLEQMGRQLNYAYFKYHEEGLPLVTLKWAQSLDGRIATLGGDSRWISSDRALRFAHRLRAIHDAVLVGIGTVLRDDPQLTVRFTRGRDPLKVVLDSRLRIPPSARLLRDPARVILASTKRADPERVEEMRRRGAEVLLLGQERVDLRGLLKELHRRGVQSVLVEGGSGILTSFLKEGLADRVIVILSPKLIGKGVEAIGDLGIRMVGEALRFRRVSFRRIGHDLVLEGWLRG